VYDGRTAVAWTVGAITSARWSAGSVSGPFCRRSSHGVDDVTVLATPTVTATTNQQSAADSADG